MAIHTYETNDYKPKAFTALVPTLEARRSDLYVRRPISRASDADRTKGVESLFTPGSRARHYGILALIGLIELLVFIYGVYNAANVGR